MNGLTLNSITAAVMFALGLAAGAAGVDYIKDGELLKQKTTYEGQIAAANKAALVASERANAIQRTIGAAITEGVAEHTVKDENEKAQDARTISDLRNSVARLRVKTSNPVCSGELPGTTASASASAGEVETTIAPAVAARLAERYADFNTVVRQLDLCQNTVLADRLRVP